MTGDGIADYEAAVEQLALLERAAKGPSFGGRRQALEAMIARCDLAYERCRVGIARTEISPEAVVADRDLAGSHKRALLDEWRRSLAVAGAGAAAETDAVARRLLLKRVDAALAVLDAAADCQARVPEPPRAVRRRRR